MGKAGQCYPADSSTALKIIGGKLVGAGVLVILLCVPTWAWVSLVGAGLILAGLFFDSEIEGGFACVHAYHLRACPPRDPEFPALDPPQEARKKTPFSGVFLFV